MARLRLADVQSRPTEWLDFTSLPLDAFHQLVPSLAAAFQAPMATWRLDGTPRTARQCAVDTTCPLPTPEDRRCFLLTYLKTYRLQGVQGRRFGLGQSQAKQWIHALFPVLLAARRTRGDAPARSLAALAQRLGVSAADAATGVTPLEEEPAPVVAVPIAAPAAPLVPMPAPSGASSAPTTLLHRPRVRAARTKTTPASMSCSSMRGSSSSASAIPLAAACLTSGEPTRRPLPSLLAVGCCRIWAASR